MGKKIEEVYVQPTVKIDQETNNLEQLEQELRQYTKDELLHKLKYDTTSVEEEKLIKKILKTK